MKAIAWAAALVPLLVLNAAAEEDTLARNEGPPVPRAKPGIYGALDISSYPRPALVSDHPVTVRPASAELMGKPLYMYVSAEQQRQWPQFCGQYNACGQPVYFVTEEWYHAVYVPDYQEELRRKSISRSKSSGSRQGAEF